MSLTVTDKLALELQRVISYCLFVFFGPVMMVLFHFKFKYKIQDLKKIRIEYKNYLKTLSGPMIICSNHLTLIDSIIQSVALGSIPGHLLRYFGLPWNLPEKTNFYHNAGWKLI